MNCTTCGNALPAGGGACTICNPWQTPTTASASAPTGIPTADGAVAKRWVKLAKRYPAEQVDMATSIRRSTTSTVANTAAYMVAAIICFAYAERPTLDGELGFLLLLAPILVGSMINRAVLQGGGWLGGAISNLKLRPDIGLPWLFSQPRFKRIYGFNIAQLVIYLVFFVLRISIRPTTYSGLQNWLIITGVVFLVAVIIQTVVFVAFIRPLAQSVQARVAVPPRTVAVSAPTAQGSVQPGAIA